MTRDEILTMKPGRELDARIAHLVMGWHITSCETYPHEKIVRVKTLRSPEESGGEVTYEKTFTKVYSSAIWNKDIPHYSTDIAAAFEAEERAIDKDPSMYIHALASVVFGYNKVQDISDIRKMCMLIHATPEQRCKAALLAVMEGEKDD